MMLPRGHNNAIKYKKIDFLTTPSTPSKEFENDFASMVSLLLLKK